MNREIRKLEKSICELTDAVKRLMASLNVPKPIARHSPAENYHLIDGPKAVCRDANCGVINSDTTTCEHTLARYQSEYDCG